MLPNPASANYNARSGGYFFIGWLEDLYREVQVSHIQWIVALEGGSFVKSIREIHVITRLSKFELDFSQIISHILATSLIFDRSP